MLDILKDPRRLANADEAAFLLNPKPGSIKLIAPTGIDDFYLAIPGDKRKSVTVLATLTAAGKVLPPFIVYPYERMPEIVKRSIPKGLKTFSHY